MPLEALIFDVDGTLAETEELHRQAFNETFRAFGLDWVWPRDLYRELLGVTGGRERILHYIDHYAPAGGVGARAKVSEMHADKTVRYVKLIRASDVAPRPGVRRLIAEAHDAGLRLAIATTTRPSDLFVDLSTVFMNTTSRSFYGEGGEILGEHSCSKDYRPNLKQMILALIVDGAGRPICTQSPQRFRCIEDAKTFCRVFFDWCN